MATKPQKTLRASFKQSQAIDALILSAIPQLSAENAQAFLGASDTKRRAALKTAILQVIGKKSFGEKPEVDPRLEAWVKLYETHFPQELALAGGSDVLRTLVLPTPKSLEFTRLIVVLKGITMNRTFAACKKVFASWRYNDDLDANIVKNDRLPNETYAVWVRDCQEADEHYKNLSANDVASRNIQGITTLERQLLELSYFIETGKHLDVVNFTLCAGSRDVDGGVPDCYWSGGKFGVGWGRPDDCGEFLRVREVSV